MTARNSLMITPWSREGFMPLAANAVPASAVWPAAQRAYYQAARIENPGIVYRLCWLNGATVGTDNAQIGIYLPNGTDGGPGTALKLGTSTLTAGANACQYDDIADTAIAAGVYWLAHWCSGTTTTVFKTAPSAMRPFGMYMESSLASGLPATATPVQATTAACPVSGLVMRSSP